MKKIRLNKEFVELLAQDIGTDSCFYREYLRKLFNGLDYEIIADEESPQLIVIYNSPPYVMFRRHAHHACPKCIFTEELIWPNPNRYDYSFSGLKSTDTNFNIICAAFFHPEFEELLSGDLSLCSLERKRTPKSRFCNFVYNQPHPIHSWRCFLYKELSKYKPVDSPGLACNNMPAIPYEGRVNDDHLTAPDIIKSRFSVGYGQSKMDFIRHYKFTLAVENRSKVGYTTEKLLHPLLVGSVPIYWGNPRAADYFNPDSFINCHDFKDVYALVEYVKKVDNDEALYRSYLEAPVLLSDSLCHHMGIESVRQRVGEMFDEVIRKPWLVTVARKPINRFIRLPRERYRRKKNSFMWRVWRNHYHRLFKILPEWGYSPYQRRKSRHNRPPPPPALLLKTPPLSTNTPSPTPCATNIPLTFGKVLLDSPF